jgi:Protein of unknown function (DUF4232)
MNMNLTSPTGRRVGAVLSVACAAIVVPVALAAVGRASVPQRAVAPVVARCAEADLRVWIGLPGDQVAEASTYQLELSNVSQYACTLEGYPGVSAFGADGQQLGSAARRAHDGYHAVSPVTLERGATVHAELTIADNDDFTQSACRPTQGDGLHVYPPNDHRRQAIPLAFSACGRRGPKYLDISQVIAGTGIPFYSY